MRILIVCRYKEHFPFHIMPFITEQAEAIRYVGKHNVEYFTVKGNGISNYLTNIKPLKKKIKEFRPDIIHAHYGLSGFTAILQHKTPVVITFHNGETATFMGNLISSVASLFAKHTIYVAQHIYNLCYFKPKRNYTIMPCGVNMDDCKVQDKETVRNELGMVSDKYYIIFGGAFDNLRKNYPLLRQAIALLDRKDIEVIEMQGLSREMITKYMCACDLFALPTKNEGSPQALKEAMACNCPIIATDVADIKHLLGNLDGHYLCSFDPNDVAAKLVQAFAFSGRTNGRKRIIELGLDNEKVAEKVIRIYQSIINKNK